MTSCLCTAHDRMDDNSVCLSSLRLHPPLNDRTTTIGTEVSRRLYVRLQLVKGHVVVPDTGQVSLKMNQGRSLSDRTKRVGKYKGTSLPQQPFTPICA